VRTYIVARNAADCVRTAAELGSEGRCRSIPGDLSTLDGIRAVASSLLAAQDRLDILVNNAGLFKAQGIDDYSEALWDDTVDLNLKAAFFLTRQLLPGLRMAGRPDDPARVIHVGSGHGIGVSPMESYAYGASKAGLHHLTRAMALRLARDHITVNAIAPGVFPSRITAEFSDETVATIKRGVPLARYGEAEDVVGALLYLTSRAGAYLTATILPVDGGWSGTR
jgi:NAD(P)-dependent dehydrogenase (short-subunit alcohol dehydrogenase family)